MITTPIKILMNWIKVNKQIVWTVVIFLLSANAFAAYFVGQERDIYFWDFMTYFQKYIILNMQLINDPVATLETVFWSIREDRYNFFAPLILTPFSYLFGVSRISYILAILNIYALPALIMTIIFTQQLAMKQNKPVHLIPWIVGGLILLSPDFWNPILFGFLDIGGVIGTIFILILYLKRDFSDQRKRDLLLIATLIAVLVIFRRWYAAWGIAFYTVLFLELFFTSFIKRTVTKERIKQNFITYFSMIAISGLIYFLAAPTYVKFVINVNIIDYQTPYKDSTNILQFLVVILNSFGIPYLALSLLGCIGAIMYKGTRKISLFLFFQSIAIFMIFTKYG